MLIFLMNLLWILIAGNTVEGKFFGLLSLDSIRMHTVSQKSDPNHGCNFVISWSIGNMLLHYLAKLRNYKFCNFVHVKLVANVTLLFVICPTDICQMSSKFVQRLTLCKYQHFTFRSFTVLSKLQALQLSKVGLSTIKHQHSKNLTPWADTTWTKNTWKC